MVLGDKVRPSIQSGLAINDGTSFEMRKVDVFWFFRAMAFHIEGVSCSLAGMAWSETAGTHGGCVDGVEVGMSLENS